MFHRTATPRFAASTTTQTARVFGSATSRMLGFGTAALMVTTGAQYYYCSSNKTTEVFCLSPHAAGGGGGAKAAGAAVVPADYKPDPSKCGVKQPGFPEYSYDDISTHNILPPVNGKAPKKGAPTPSVWIHYKAGVYDITEFIIKHPGGEKRIALAAGGGVEKFWNIYTLHNDDAVRAILEPYRIGNVKDYKAAPKVNTEELWINEPKRSSGLGVKNPRPFNAETPEAIMDEFITPNDLFFVRNHMPVPDVKLEGGLDDGKGGKTAPFCLEVGGENYVSRCFSIEELKKNFPQRTVTTTIQCGGNRRSEMTAQQERDAAEEAGAPAPRAVKGLSWSNGGIGTANWTGVLLSDVMAACLLPSSSPFGAGTGTGTNGTTTTVGPNMDSYHVHFFGADSDAIGPFSVSVPLSTVADKDNEVLVAMKMNGEDIPRDHGYPLRAIVPGHVGVRNCKWLNRVSVEPIEAQSVWQQSDYKHFPQWATKPDPSLPSVQNMPVQSSVTSATYDSSNDEVNVKGYAYCGGGTGIQRVEISLNGGKTFQAAANLKTDQPERLPHANKDSLRHAKKQWAWTMFEATLDVEKVPESFKVDASGQEDKTFNVCSKAITVDNASQPARGTYNFRGLLFNGFSCRDADVM